MSANVEAVELLPCPLCKRQPKRNGRIGLGGVVCTGDNATVGMIHRFQTYGADQAEADGAWNLAALSRPSPAPSEQSGLGREVAGIASVIRAFPNDDAWGGADQAEQVAAILDRASAALALPDCETIARALIDTGVNIGASTWPDEQFTDALILADAILALANGQGGGR